MAHKERVKGIAIHRPIVYGNIAVRLPEEDRQNGHTHRWTVAVRSAASPHPLPKGRPAYDTVGGADDLSPLIRRVSFKLHDTYANPNRNVDKPPFEVTETGWGEFEIGIKIFFVADAQEKPLALTHFLKLLHWPAAPFKPITITADPDVEKAGGGSGTSNEPRAETGELPDWPGVDRPALGEAPLEASKLPAPGEVKMDDDGDAVMAKADEPLQAASATSDHAENSSAEDSASVQSAGPSIVQSWQYDEIVFTEPSETFYATLLSLPPTPLPPTSQFVSTPEVPISRLGVTGHKGLEMTQELEEVEGKRLEWAKMEVLRQVKVWRERLIRKEEELKDLKAQMTAG